MWSWCWIVAYMIKDQSSYTKLTIKSAHEERITIVTAQFNFICFRTRMCNVPCTVSVPSSCEEVVYFILHLDAHIYSIQQFRKTLCSNVNQFQLICQYLWIEFLEFKKSSSKVCLQTKKPFWLNICLNNLIAIFFLLLIPFTLQGNLICMFP